MRTLIRRGEKFHLVVERGNPPLSHDLRAVPWEEVETVDHDSLALTLRVDQDELERALELDPAKGVEDGDADAQRVTELPPGLRQPSLPGSEAGPVDRPTYVAAISFFAIGLLAALGLALVVTASRKLGSPRSPSFPRFSSSRRVSLGTGLSALLTSAIKAFGASSRGLQTRNRSSKGRGRESSLGRISRPLVGLPTAAATLRSALLRRALSDPRLVPAPLACRTPGRLLPPPGRPTCHAPSPPDRSLSSCP